MADVAWSTIKTANEDGSIELIQPGETVSASDVGGDEGLAQLKAAGAVREAEYPDDVKEGESVRERNIRVVNEKMDEINQAGYDLTGVKLADIGFDSLPPTPTADDAEEVEAPAKKPSSGSKSSSGNS